MKNIQKKVLKYEETIAVQRKRGLYLQYFLTSYTIFASLLFVVLAIFAHLFHYFPIDLSITSTIQNIHTSWFLWLMNVVSYPGYYPQALIIIGVTCLIFMFIRSYIEAGCLFLNAVIQALLGLGIKDIVNRPRPTGNLVHVLSHFTQNSFPSGHVLFYTSFLGFLCFLIFSSLEKSFLRTLLLTLLVLFIALVGVSRIFLGAHWASDVVGGYLLGSIILVLTIKMYLKVKQSIIKEK